MSGQRQHFGGASHQLHFFVVLPASLRVLPVGVLSAFATGAPGFVRTSISFSAGAVRRNVVTSPAVRLPRVGHHLSAFLRRFKCSVIVLKGRASVSPNKSFKRTPQAPLNSSVSTQMEDLALFDFDGTITTHETMPVFLRQSISRKRKVIGSVLFAPLVLGYKSGFVSGTTIRRLLVRFAYRGVSASALAVAGSEFAHTYLANVLRPEAVSRILWHKSQGHRVVVVSGGLDVYLEPWCKEQGVELLCSSLQQQDGILTGLYLGRQCVHAEKARVVQERYNLASRGTIYAYGDTPEDKHLLSLATRPYYRWQEVGARAGC